MQDHTEMEKIVNVLEDKKYRTHVTHSPDEAMELARQIRFGLILLETKLDPINGLELYLALKQILPETVTIMLADSEGTFIEQAKEAVQNNAYAFLKKPLEMDTFINILDRLKKQLNSNIIDKPGFQE
jgi:DNA-binding NtrC family response regulator